jgi:hypothetical protein
MFNGIFNQFLDQIPPKVGGFFGLVSVFRFAPPTILDGFSTVWSRRGKLWVNRVDVFFAYRGKKLCLI